MITTTTINKIIKKDVDLVTNNVIITTTTTETYDDGLGNIVSNTNVTSVSESNKINIVEAKISNDLKSLYISANKIGNFNVVSIFIITTDGREINVTDLIQNPLINPPNVEITVPISKLNEKYFNGVYYIKLISEDGEKVLALVANFTYFKECLLKSTINTIGNDCNCEDKVLKNIDVLLKQNLLLEVLTNEIKNTILFTDKKCGTINTESINLLNNELKRYCTCSLKDLDLSYFPNVGFKIENNKIVEIKDLLDEVCN